MLPTPSGLLITLSILGVASAATYTVIVGITETDGYQGLGFDPSAILPQAGDAIEFTFQLPDYIKNPASVQHTVTQSTFENPCTPKDGGFDTGIQISGGTGPSFTLTVNDTQPLWFYSYANQDCNAGMVLAVNPLTSGQTLAAFQEAAKTAVINTPALSSLPSSVSTASSGTNTATESSSTTSNAGHIVGAALNMALILGTVAVAAI